MFATIESGFAADVCLIKDVVGCIQVGDTISPCEVMWSSLETAVRPGIPCLAGSFTVLVHGCKVHDRRYLCTSVIEHITLT